MIRGERMRSKSLINILGILIIAQIIMASNLRPPRVP